MKKGKASIDDMYADLLNLGSIFNVEDKAEKLVRDYKAELKSFKDDLETGEPVRICL